MDRSTFRKLESVQGTCAHNIKPPNKNFLRKKIFYNYFFSFGENLAQVKTIWAWWTNPISSIFLEFWEISPKVANYWEANKKVVFFEKLYVFLKKKNIFHPKNHKNSQFSSNFILNSLTMFLIPNKYIHFMQSTFCLHIVKYLEYNKHK